MGPIAIATITHPTNFFSQCHAIPFLDRDRIFLEVGQCHVKVIASNNYKVPFFLDGVFDPDRLIGDAIPNLFDAAGTRTVNGDVVGDIRLQIRLTKFKE